MLLAFSLEGQFVPTKQKIGSARRAAKIARDVLRNMSRWPEIAALNSLRAPYVIRPGQVLRLPDAGGIAPASPSTPPVAVAVPLVPPVPIAIPPAGGGLVTLIRSPKLWFAFAAVAAWWFFGAKPKRPRRRHTSVTFSRRLTVAV